MVKTWSALGALAVGGVASSAMGQFLLVPDSTADRVVALNADGTLANANYLDTGSAAAAAGVSSLPIEAVEVGDEVWVSDQTADRVWRFDKNSGALLGDIGAGTFSNIRGMALVGNTMYVAEGSTSAGFGQEGIYTIDVGTLSVTGIFSGRADADTSYWDVFEYNGELLVTNSDSGNDGIERYAFDGTFLGNFASSDGTSSFDFMQQMAERSSNGNLLGGGFSLPSGVYEFMPDGTPLGIVAADGFGPRGVHELPNGEVLWTNGAAIQTDTGIVLDGGSFRFISTASVPAPGVSLLAVGLCGYMARRRR